MNKKVVDNISHFFYAYGADSLPKILPKLFCRIASLGKERCFYEEILFLFFIPSIFKLPNFPTFPF
jgi:hypothetical protein